jgi:hypothetical protein
MSSAKLHKYGRNWGSRNLGYWLEIVLGSRRVDFYWEPMNGWRRFHVQRWALLIGPLTIIAQNWRKHRA